MKILFVLAFCLLLWSCVEAPEETTASGNFTIEKLFEHEGCNMYRFKDGTRYIYWSDCRGKINADYSTSTGKSRTTHREETITTQ